MAADSNAPPPLTDAELDALRVARTGGDRSRLAWSGFTVFSQSGEDGIIAKSFRRIGIRHRTCIAFGCETGHENNTGYLLEQAWHGLWIEGVPDDADAIRWQQRDHLACGRLCISEAFVNRRHVSDLFHTGCVTGEIDSTDDHVFEAITVVRPRIVAPGHTHAFEANGASVMSHDDEYRRDPRGGAGGRDRAGDHMARTRSGEPALGRMPPR